MTCRQEKMNVTLYNAAMDHSVPQGCYGISKKRESLTSVAFILKALIGIASKVAPPAALPLSCCTPTSVSPLLSLEGGAGEAGQPGWWSLIEA